MTHSERLRPTQRDLRRHPHLSLVAGLKRYGPATNSAPPVAKATVVTKKVSTFWLDTLSTALGTLLTAAVVAATIFVFAATAKAEARDIHQSQLDIQAHGLIERTNLPVNVQTDDLCIGWGLGSNNATACSDAFGAWIPPKNYLITKIKVTIVGASGDNGECRLSLWTDTGWDATFGVQIGSNMDFDGAVATGTTYDFTPNINVTAGVPIGFILGDDDQAGTCTSVAGNDVDVHVFIYGKATN